MLAVRCSSNSENPHLKKRRTRSVRRFSWYNKNMRIPITLKVITVVAAALFIMPIVTSAQVVNTSASVQQSFLTQLQALQQQLASLEATLNSLIAAAGGTVSSLASSTAAVPAPHLPAIPALTSTLSNTSNLSGNDLTAALLQAIATPANAATTTAPTTTSVSVTSSTGPVVPATQLSPSCIAGLFANGAQCGGLYYCTAGIQSSGYWSATSCLAAE